MKAAFLTTGPPCGRRSGRSGHLQADPGMLKEDPGMLKADPGILQEDPGIFRQILFKIKPLFAVTPKWPADKTCLFAF